MRQTISGMLAAAAVMMTVGASPAMACYGACAPAPVYVAPAPTYSGCYTGCGGWARERLPDPVQQYYYVNQGPTYTGPGNYAPRPIYREGAIAGYGYGYNRPYRHRAHRYYHRHHHGYAARFHHGQRVLRRYY
jgi:hypothetical protein